jgi:uncharacterized protein (DUF169 family)
MILSEYQQAGAELYRRLQLPTYPVAVKFIASESDIPSGVIRPKALGVKWSLCQAHTYARCWGWHTAITAEDNFCVPASAMHRWLAVTPEEFVESQVRQGWHQDRAAELNRYRQIERFFIGPEGENRRQKAEATCGFVASPLHDTVVEPDTVLIFGNGLHLMHLVHALCYRYQTPVTSAFEGFGEACFKGGLLPFLTGQPQIVIPGMGDRSFAGIADDEVAISFPGTLLSTVLEDLFKTGGKMNLGQPAKRILPNHLTEELTPGFKYLRERADEKVRPPIAPGADSAPLD